MKLVVKILISLSIALSANSVLYAGDKAAGKTKAAACVACHGEKGLSKDSMYPSLAGQKPAYIVGQLKMFKAGVRKGPMMEPTAKSLSNEDMNDIAAYFASLENKTKHHPKEETTPQLTIDKANMCKGCHGRFGEGRGVFPRLRNQHYQYLEAQLNAYKAGTRKGGPMIGIASSLSDEDIKAISHYFSNLNVTKE
ncbi:MAG: cytochrome c4 [Methylococcales bacterium]|nr:cytochrome c4 [Methylococcales bacterium]